VFLISKKNKQNERERLSNEEAKLLEELQEQGMED